jgi:hypothetical protein
MNKNIEHGTICVLKKITILVLWDNVVKLCLNINLKKKIFFYTIFFKEKYTLSSPKIFSYESLNMRNNLLFIPRNLILIIKKKVIISNNLIELFYV